MSGQRASAAPGGGNGCDHDAGAAAAHGLNAVRTCAAVRPLPAVRLRGYAPAHKRLIIWLKACSVASQCGR
ncbi:hypothetical protein NUM25_004446 [Salmonella enterica]|nr:hypothetical protein [Salmonella enterica]